MTGSDREDADAAFALLTGPGAPFELETVTTPHGPARNFARRDRSMSALVERAAGRGDATFLVHAGHRLSFAEFAGIVRGTAAGWIEGHGLEKGDRVAVLGENSIAWLVAMFSATAAGAIGVAINTSWSRDEVAFALEDSSARFLVVDAGLVEEVAPLLHQVASLEALLIMGLPADDGVAFDSIVRSSDEVVRVAIDEHDPFAILYTSGTTGRPKGCVTTHAGTIAQIRLAILTGVLGKRASAPEGSRSPRGRPTLLATTPMFHVSGLHAAVGLALATGTTVVMTEGRFDPGEVLRLIDQERVTMWGAVPTMVHRLVECPEARAADLSSLEHVSIGGAPLPPTVMERARSLLPVGAKLGNGYGLTETHGPVTMNAGQSLADRPDSVGRPTPLVEVRIVAPDGNVRLTGEVGEVQVRGATVTPGYWNRPDENADVFAEGWLRTGDLGYVDEDGFLYLVDRLKDMVIRAGENVYCAEVEAALCLLPGVDEAAVFGVADPDLGERVEAAVHPVRGATLDSQELRRSLQRHLARYKVPDRIVILERPLPRNAAGKVVKDEVRRLSIRLP